jgi:hypothetical protein
MKSYQNRLAELLTNAAKVTIMIIEVNASSDNIPTARTVGIERVRLQLIQMLSVPLLTLGLLVATTGLN